ncbi:ABC transporter permease [uncultured Microbacterium sp.]|uniref:ABC transporter permease n=1 Tax=uncultured Microbacterium sp. TaxID=191216 RepID=UPI0028DC3533|nr:ABC transporter permease [uncultured Microbacterium sp.]
MSLAVWRVLRRLGVSLVTLWGAATLTFFALRLVPVDPAFAILGAGQQQVDISPEVLAVVRAEYHLDEPLIVQYLLYLGRLVRGDLGMSYVQEQPVAPLLAAQAGPTVALALAAIVLAVVISLVGGVLTAGRRLPSAISSGIELVLASTPVFWLGFVLMLVFAVWLRALPILDSGDLRSLVLPALTLALPTAALLLQVLRQSLDDALEQPFILSARARGLGSLAVTVGHALRHAAVPYLTMLGFSFGALLGGAAITETLFSRPGLGRLLVDSVAAQDIPVVIGVVLVATAVFILVNTLVDLSYGLVDPRVREAERVPTAGDVVAAGIAGEPDAPADASASAPGAAPARASAAALAADASASVSGASNASAAAPMPEASALEASASEASASEASVSEASAVDSPEVSR